MATLIKIINSNIRIEFDKGNFDDWCVYLTRFEGKRYAPPDTEYFGRLQQIGKLYTPQKVYNDFIQFYNPTGKTISKSILTMIDLIAEGYADDKVEVNMWFTVVYAGMIAEENKAYSILKKRIKCLGMHQVLLENQTPDYAANFSKRKKWTELDLIMKASGI